MALRRAPLARRAARSITAAATRLDPKDRAQARKETKQRPLDWQKAAFDFYDQVGEVRFGANWMANALSRVRLVPAFAPEPGQQPILVGSTEEARDAGADEQERMAAQSVLARLGSSEGGEAEIMRGFGLQLFVPGEAYLIGRDDPDVRDAELWGVYSVEAIVVDTDGRYAIKPAPNTPRNEYLVVDDNAFVLRVMRRHPRYPEWPDSAMRGALDYCEDLRILTAMIRAAASSRVPSKILGVPQEASFGPADTTTDEGDGDEAQDQLTRDMIEHFTTPLQDPRSAASMVPFILRLAGEDLDKMQVFDLTREIDTLAIQLRDETRRAFAASVDLPAEILTGRSDLNHWTMASVTEEAFRNHVEPYAQGIVDALTFGYFRPSLGELVDDPRQWSIGYDPAGLVSSPDQSEDVRNAYDRGEVTGAYYRDVLGIPEEAAPNEEELLHRERLARIVGIARRDGQVVQPVASQPAPDTGPRAVAAAAPVIDVPAIDPPRTLHGLGERLARMEMALRERLRIVCDEALHRALERAGSRLRSLAQRDKAGPAWRAIDGVPAHLVAATLGSGLVAGLGTSADSLLEAAWARVEDRWHTLVEQTQREALAAVVAAARAAGMEPGPAGEWSAWSARLAMERDEGAAVLVDGLAALARERLFDPTQPVPEQGEWDSTLAVSPRLVRRALQAAGNGGVLTAAAGDPIGGLLSGDTVLGMLRDIATAKFGGGYVWLWGGADRPFPPHADLDGVPFMSWQDDVLANYDDFPDGEFFFPDDHDGCTCEVVREVEREGRQQSVTAVRSRVARERATAEKAAKRTEQAVSGRSREGWGAWGEARGINGADTLWASLEASGVSEADASALQTTLDRLLVEHAATLRGDRGIRSIASARLPVTRDGAQFGITIPTNEGGSSIRITSNPKAWAKKAQDIKAGWSVGFGDATDTVLHEVGHASHQGLRAFGVEPAEFAAVSIERAEWAANTVGQRSLSRYLGGNAGKNGKEMFADAYKMQHHPTATLTGDGRAALDEYVRSMNEWVAERTEGQVTSII